MGVLALHVRMSTELVTLRDRKKERKLHRILVLMQLNTVKMTIKILNCTNNETWVIKQIEVIYNVQIVFSLIKSVVCEIRGFLFENHYKKWRTFFLNREIERMFFLFPPGEFLRDTLQIFRYSVLQLKVFQFYNLPIYQFT